MLDELPQRLILGCGYAERLEPDPLRDRGARQRGVKVEALPTADAVDALRGARGPRPRGRRGGAPPDLLIGSCRAGAGPGGAGAGGRRRELRRRAAVRRPAPAAARAPPVRSRARRPGSRSAPGEAIRIADGADAVRDERAESPGMRPIAFERGDRLAGELLHRLRTEPHRGRPGDRRRTHRRRCWAPGTTSSSTPRSPAATRARSPRRSTRPYVWLPLCLLFLAPVLRSRGARSASSISTCSCCSGSASRSSSSTAAEITDLGPAHLSGAGLRPRADARGRDSGRASATGRWSRWCRSAGSRSRAIAARLRADRAQRRRLARDRHRRRRRDRRRPHRPRPGALQRAASRPGVGIRGDVYGPFNYLAYVPFEAIFPWNGHWGDVPAAHAAAIAFDLLTALGLVALGRRLRAGARRAGARDRARVRLARLPVHALHDERERQRLADRGARGRRDAGARLAAGPGRAASRWRPRRSSGSAALAPLFATGDRRAALALGARLLGRLRGRRGGACVVPFLPDGGLREFYDRTLGYQASRSSPFSVWGLAPSLDFLRPVERAVAVGAGVRGRLLARAARRRPRSRRWRRR